MKTFQYKLYASKKNKALHSQIDLAAEIYNHCIALHRRYYRLYKKSLHVYALQKHLTKLKKQKRYSHWNKLGSQAIQDVVERIDKSYKLFFRNIKHNIKAGTPHFRKRCWYKSFTLTQAGYKLLEGNKIRIGNKIYRYSNSRNIQGNIKTLTVKRDTLGDVYIYITTDFLEQRATPQTGKSVGFDFGLKVFLTASDGKDILSPLFFQQHRADIKSANRQLSWKQRGSNNRAKARKSLGRLHKRVENKRADFHWKIANQLTDNYDYLFFENLNIKAMQQLWGRKISDIGFHSFMKKVEYLASIKAKTVHYINRFEPSSKTCSVCGQINHELRLKDRAWLCAKCGTNHDRDRNASYNILRVGASTLGLGDVSPVEILAIAA